jgi:hypothetical protein
MKLLDFDWRSVFPRLDAWEGAAAGARRLLQDAQPNEPIELARLGPDGERFCQAGILQAQANGLRATAHPEGRPFLQLVRLVRLAPVLSLPTHETLQAYIGEVLTIAEATALAIGSRGNNPVHMGLRGSLTSVEWPSAFLRATDLRAWERQHAENPYLAYQHRLAPSAPRFQSEGVATAARAILSGLMERPGPVPLREVHGLAPGSSSEHVAQALPALLQFALAFPAERPQDGALVLSLWPGISARLHRPLALEPKQVRVEGALSTAYGAEDLAVLLAGAAREPLRLRANDGRLFERRAQELRARLTPQPPALERFLASPRAGPSWRLERARSTARALGWIARTNPSHAPHDEITPQGREWLALGVSAQLKALYDLLRLAA